MDPKYLGVTMLLATQVNWSNDLFVNGNKKQLTDQNVDGIFLKTFIADFGNNGTPDPLIVAKLKDLADPATTKTWADVNRKLFDAVAFAFAKNARNYTPPPCPRNVSVIIDAINSTPPLIPE